MVLKKQMKIFEPGFLSHCIIKPDVVIFNFQNKKLSSARY